jgi:hypothetical protein
LFYPKSVFVGTSGFFCSWVAILLGDGRWERWRGRRRRRRRRKKKFFVLENFFAARANLVCQFTRKA